MNPICPRTLLVEARPGNRSGQSEYCSKECYSIWNPSIRDIARILGAKDPVEFRRFLQTSLDNVGSQNYLKRPRINSAPDNSLVGETPRDYPTDIKEILEKRTPSRESVSKDEQVHV